jgi:hypothetical protein
MEIYLCSSQGTTRKEDGATCSPQENPGISRHNNLKMVQRNNLINARHENLIFVRRNNLKIAQNIRHGFTV